MSVEQESPATNLLEKSIKYVAIFSVLATGLSFASNVILFANWGLNYSIVASPSDVIIGALEAFGVLGLPLLAVLLGYLLGSFAFGWISKRLHAALLFTLGSLFLITTLRSSPFYDIVALAGASELQRPLLTTFGIFLVSLSISPTLRLYRGDKTVRVFFSLLAFFLAFSYFSFSSAFRSGEITISRSNSPTLPSEASSRCDSIEYVVWVGTASILTSCEGPPFDSDGRYFVIPKSGVEMAVRSNSKRKNNAQTH
ncbi:hypothetical protein [Erythrobacter sp.]|uniref:hypothetical protein n=1 Tax=Erythrobacter sp. TaxID=1042 RepID=UPI001B29015D|nr:hypothetical protein [Erythrobacter sp.]MBO6526758.1 hypothetical protein [Erythrobacter sp.]MBO6528431.1 hypothetical protein [Erythrobacter sp.]